MMLGTLWSFLLPIHLVSTSFQGGEIHPRGVYVHPCQLEMATTAIPKCSSGAGFPLIGEGQQRVPEPKSKRLGEIPSQELHGQGVVPLGGGLQETRLTRS